MRLMHVITDLDTGGAQIMLRNLIEHLHGSEFQHIVVCLLPPGPTAREIEQFRVPVISLGMRRGIPRMSAFTELVRIVREQKPDLMQTWMYHSDLMGGLAARYSGPVPVIWSIHNGGLDPRAIRRQTRWIVAVCAHLSRWVPDRIVCCSESAKAVHVSAGYATEKMLFIPNGFNLDRFRPDPCSRLELREELGLGEGVPIIGLVGRFHPEKDHNNFLKAAALTAREHPGVHFVLCGDDVTADNTLIARWVDGDELRGRVHLLGNRSDIPRIQAALDIATSASFSEAFPLVVAEAMASGVVCVVTDVGDSAAIVGDTGFVVPARSPEALARAWSEVLSLTGAERIALGMRARDRIGTRFGMEEVARLYAELYRSTYRESGREPLPV